MPPHHDASFDDDRCATMNDAMCAMHDIVSVTMNEMNDDKSAVLYDDVDDDD